MTSRKLITEITYKMDIHSKLDASKKNEDGSIIYNWDSIKNHCKNIKPDHWDSETKKWSDMFKKTKVLRDGNKKLNSKLVLKKCFYIRFKYENRWWNFNTYLRRGILTHPYKETFVFITDNLWYCDELKCWIPDPTRQLKKGKYHDKFILNCIDKINQNFKETIHHLIDKIENYKAVIEHQKNIIEYGQGDIKCPMCRKDGSLKPCFIDGCKCAVCFDECKTILECGHPLCKECGDRIIESNY